MYQQQNAPSSNPNSVSTPRCQVGSASLARPLSPFIHHPGAYEAGDVVHPPPNRLWDLNNAPLPDPSKFENWNGLGDSAELVQNAQVNPSLLLNPPLNSIDWQTLNSDAADRMIAQLVSMLQVQDMNGPRGHRDNSLNDFPSPNAPLAGAPWGASDALLFQPQAGQWSTGYEPGLQVGSLLQQEWGINSRSPDGSAYQQLRSPDSFPPAGNSAPLLRGVADLANGMSWPPNFYIPDAPQRGLAIPPSARPPYTTLGLGSHDSGLDGAIGGHGWEDLTRGVQDRITAVCNHCSPYVKMNHWDAGVRHWLIQITALFGEEVALNGLATIENAQNLMGVRNMRAFITTRLIDHYEQHVFLQDPQVYASRRLLPDQYMLLKELVSSGKGLTWANFDPKVLDTVRETGSAYVRARLERLSSKDLAGVQNVAAYIFTLLSKRGRTAKQAAAAKGQAEATLAALSMPGPMGLSPHGPMVQSSSGLLLGDSRGGNLHHVHSVNSDLSFMGGPPLNPPPAQRGMSLPPSPYTPFMSYQLGSEGLSTKAAGNSINAAFMRMGSASTYPSYTPASSFSPAGLSPVDTPGRFSPYSPAAAVMSGHGQGAGTNAASPSRMGGPLNVAAPPFAPLHGSPGSVQARGPQRPAQGLNRHPFLGGVGQEQQGGHSYTPTELQPLSAFAKMSSDVW